MPRYTRKGDNGPMPQDARQANRNVASCFVHPSRQTHLSPISSANINTPESLLPYFVSGFRGFRFVVIDQTGRDGEAVNGLRAYFSLTAWLDLISLDLKPG